MPSIRLLLLPFLFSGAIADLVCGPNETEKTFYYSIEAEIITESSSLNCTADEFEDISVTMASLMAHININGENIGVPNGKLETGGCLEFMEETTVQQNGHQTLRRRLYIRRFIFKGSGYCRYCWTDNTDGRRLQMSALSHDPADDYVLVNHGPVKDAVSPVILQVGSRRFKIPLATTSTIPKPADKPRTSEGGASPPVMVVDNDDEVLTNQERHRYEFVPGSARRLLQQGLPNPFLQGVDPNWWELYRAKYGKRVKRCMDIPQVPSNGSPCPRKKIGEYNCLFGDQTCPDGSQHPKVKCDCLLNSGVWNCVDYEPCGTIKHTPHTTCPTKHPLDFPYKLTCQSDFLVCNYGRQDCCGDAVPASTCECIDGEFICFKHETCRYRDCTNVPSCPSTEPTPGSSCSHPIRSTCAYETKRCCDMDWKSRVHHCFNSKWDIVTDILYTGCDTCGSSLGASPLSVHPTVQTVALQLPSESSAPSMLPLIAPPDSPSEAPSLSSSPSYAVETSSPTTRRTRMLNSVWIDVITDKNPQETRIRIENLDDGNRTVYDSGFEFTLPEHFNSTRVLLSRGVQYKFIVEDSGGDGLCCRRGDAFVVMTDAVGGMLAEATANFGLKTEEVFQVEGPFLRSKKGRKKAGLYYMARLFEYAKLHADENGQIGSGENTLTFVGVGSKNKNLTLEQQIELTWGNSTSIDGMQIQASFRNEDQLKNSILPIIETMASTVVALELTSSYGRDPSSCLYETNLTVRVNLTAREGDEAGANCSAQDLRRNGTTL